MAKCLWTEMVATFAFYSTSSVQGVFLDRLIFVRVFISSIVSKLTLIPSEIRKELLIEAEYYLLTEYILAAWVRSTVLVFLLVLINRAEGRIKGRCRGEGWALLVGQQCHLYRIPQYRLGHPQKGISRYTTQNAECSMSRYN